MSRLRPNPTRAPAARLAALLLAGLLPLVLAACGAASATPTTIPIASPATPSAAITLARTKVAGALQAYAAVQTGAAYDLAALAYLDGFEILETAVGAQDAALVTTLESEFKALRDGVQAGRPLSELQPIADQINTGLSRALALVSP